MSIIHYFLLSFILDFFFLQVLFYFLLLSCFCSDYCSKFSPLNPHIYHPAVLTITTSATPCYYRLLLYY